MSKNCVVRNNFRITVLAYVLLFLVSASGAIAQLPTATILGVVKDSSGAVLPNAKLTARDVETGQTRTASSAADGSYRFPAVPVGAYEVLAESDGFQTEARKGLELTVSQEAVVNFTLQVGAVTQTVAVTAEAPLVNTTSGSLGGLVGEQAVADLPLNGRNYNELALLEPGISQHKNVSLTSQALVGVLYSSNGATIHSNNFLLDGAIMQASGGAIASTTGSTLGVDGIREYRIVTNSFSAEYGMTMGSQTLIVSKGGTNSYHGSAFDYLRNNVFDARNFFQYISPVTPYRIPPFKRNSFGGSFGGPIKKDKTFFFGAFEALRERLGITPLDNPMSPGCHVQGGVCTSGTGTTSFITPALPPVLQPILALFPLPNLPNNQYTYAFTQPTNENYGQMRVDHTFSQNDSAFVRYTIDDTRQTQNGAYGIWSTTRGSRYQYLTLAESHVFSPALLNTARFSISRTNAPLLSGPSLNLTGPQYSLVQGESLGGISVGSGVTGLGGNGLSPNRKTQNIYTTGEDLFYTKGRHSLKFGTMINHFMQYTLNGSGQLGSLSYSSLQNFFANIPSSFSGVTAGSLHYRIYDYNTFGFYAQDDFKVTPTLTLNIGLRYEFNTQVTEKDGHGAALRNVQTDAALTVGVPLGPPKHNNFSPRFGFAWDVMGDGKTALRGGFGLLYDIATYANALSAGVNNSPPISSGSSEASPPGPTSFPLVFDAAVQGKQLRGLDYNSTQPHILQYNMTVDRQLPGNMDLTVAYAGSRGLDIFRIEDANPVLATVLSDGQLFWSGTGQRVNPSWTSMEWYSSGSNSWYNALQVSLLKRMSKGLQFQTSYTFSKSIDTSETQINAENQGTSDWLTYAPNENIDKSLSAFDTPQNVRFNLIYSIPNIASSNGFLGRLVNGWRWSNILSMQTGYPFTVTESSNRSRDATGVSGGGTDRPDVAPGFNLSNITSGTTAGCPGVAPNQALGTPDLYFDPCAFTLQLAGQLGSSGRNVVRGPGFADMDVAFSKDAPLKFLGESGKLEFRADAFNLLNRANFALPGRSVFAGTATDVTEPISANAGRITTTGVATNRELQFALKIIF